MINFFRLPLLLLPAFFATTIGQQPPTSEYEKPPNQYSITEIRYVGTRTLTKHTYRDGTKARVDVTALSGNTQGTDLHSQYYFDSHIIYSWYKINGRNSCAKSTFSGDWIEDPFFVSARMRVEIANHDVKELGTEFLNGISTNVLESFNSKTQVTLKVWTDIRYGLWVKIERNGKPFSETKQIEYGKPDASNLLLDESCK